MKRLLAIILVACSTPAIAQERNPHAGFTNVILPERDHKNVTRLDPPEDFRKAIEQMQYGMLRPNGANRAFTGHVIPFAKAAPVPGQPQVYGIFEDRWWEYFENAGNPQFVESLSSRVRTLRYHHADSPPGRGNATYSDWVDVDPDRKYFSFCKTFKTGYVGLGADFLKVHGTAIIEMGLRENTVRVIPKQVSTGDTSRIAVSQDFTCLLNGVRHLKVTVGTGEAKFLIPMIRVTEWPAN